MVGFVYAVAVKRPCETKRRRKSDETNQAQRCPQEILVRHLKTPQENLTYDELIPPLVQLGRENASPKDD